VQDGTAERLAVHDFVDGRLDDLWAAQMNAPGSLDDDGFIRQCWNVGTPRGTTAKDGRELRQ